MTDARRAAPRAPIRVGIIGCGNVALHDHVPAYLALPDLWSVVGIADPSAERRELVGSRLGLPASARHESLDALLERTDLDVVDICAPPGLHRAAAEAAAATGRHILCEKPLATTPRDADAIVAAADAAGIVLAVAHNYLLFPEVAALRRVIADGSIGAVQVVLIDLLGVDDNPGAAAYQPRWRHGPAAGGGVLMDMIHLVYLAEALLGQPFERVTATIDAWPAESEVESLALCRFDGSTGSASVNVGWGVGPGGLRVSGTAGRAEVRYRGGGTGPYIPIEAAFLTTPDGASQPIDTGGPRDTHRLLIEDVGRALLDGRATLADGAAGARAVSAAVAAYRSAATGETVTLPLPPDDPVYRDGVLGLRELTLPSWSPVRRRALFGITGHAS